MTANSWIASSSVGAPHTTAEWTMTECLNGGNGQQVREMSASQVTGEKALWSPRHSSPSSAGFQRGWEHQRSHLPFPSPTRALCPGIGRAHWVWASQVVSDKESVCQCRRHGRHGFDPWVGKIPWRRKMATHFNILAWEIPWTEEPGGLPSMGSQRVRIRQDLAIKHAYTDCLTQRQNLKPSFP